MDHLGRHSCLIPAEDWSKGSCFQLPTELTLFLERHNFLTCYFLRGTSGFHSITMQKDLDAPSPRGIWGVTYKNGFHQLLLNHPLPCSSWLFAQVFILAFTLARPFLRQCSVLHARSPDCPVELGTTSSPVFPRSLSFCRPPRSLPSPPFISPWTLRPFRGYAHLPARCCGIFLSALCRVSLLWLYEVFTTPSHCTDSPSSFG